MTTGSPLRALFPALMLAGGLAAAAQAGEDTPTAEPKATSVKECVVDSGGFREDARGPAFVVALENQCERRLECKVSVYVTGAKGPAQGEATLILAPRSEGDASRKSYVLKVKTASGMAQSSHECSAI